MREVGGARNVATCHGRCSERTCSQQHTVNLGTSNPQGRSHKAEMYKYWAPARSE